MRKVVLAMISTLNGRLDSPHEWVTAISDAVEQQFVRIYDNFDTIVVGHTTYDEMAGFWPTAETDKNQPDTNKQLAAKMNAYKKYVFTSSGKELSLHWNNTEQVSVKNDDDIIQSITALKAQSGADIHLAGGARFAQTCIRLGLIDEYHLYVYPVISHGVSWFDQLKDKRILQLISATPYDNGLVGLYYKA